MCNWEMLQKDCYDINQLLCNKLRTSNIFLFPVAGSANLNMPPPWLLMGRWSFVYQNISFLMLDDWACTGLFIHNDITHVSMKTMIDKAWLSLNVLLWIIPILLKMIMLMMCWLKCSLQIDLNVSCISNLDLPMANRYDVNLINSELPVTNWYMILFATGK